MNKDWIRHVKQYASTHHINYFDALQSIECQQLYQKKERSYEGIKELRKKQNDLVINFLNKPYDIKGFQKKYLEIEQKIKQKSDDLKRYRAHYKIRLMREKA